MNTSQPLFSRNVFKSQGSTYNRDQRSLTSIRDPNEGTKLESHQAGVAVMPRRFLLQKAFGAQKQSKQQHLKSRHSSNSSGVGYRGCSGRRRSRVPLATQGVEGVCNAPHTLTHPLPSIPLLLADAQQNKVEVPLLTAHRGSQRLAVDRSGACVFMFSLPSLRPSPPSFLSCCRHFATVLVRYCCEFV